MTATPWRTWLTCVICGEQRRRLDRQLQALHMLGVLTCLEEEGIHQGKDVTLWRYALAPGIDPDVLDPDFSPDFSARKVTQDHWIKKERSKRRTRSTKTRTQCAYLPTFLALKVRPKTRWPSRPRRSTPPTAHGAAATAARATMTPGVDHWRPTRRTRTTGRTSHEPRDRPRVPGRQSVPGPPVHRPARAPRMRLPAPRRPRASAPGPPGDTPRPLDTPPARAGRSRPGRAPG